ncbi:MAG TPA: hypothetical protein VKH19_01315 [Gemmatimonadaceae bacterium]|nr:hypothetical protein [Gemmatimonadaceae bacterium]
MRLMPRVALVFAASVLAFPALSAQTSFSIAAGATVPVGDAGDAMKMGYNLTAGLGIKAPLAPIGLRIEGMFSQMDWKNSPQGNTTILAGIANATVSMMPTTYFIGGLGLYNMRAGDLPAGFTSDPVTKFGINVGAGLNIPLTGFGTFVEARLHYIMTKDDASGAKNTTLIPISFGIRF